MKRAWRVRLLATALFVAVVAVAAGGGLDWLQLHAGVALPSRSGPPMLVVAHRGDLNKFPEDTLEAIVAAAAEDVAGIEFDVHKSVEGTWWVIHDPTLDRTTDRTGDIARLLDRSIEGATIDGGFGFDPQRHIGLRVPTLSSVLHALEDYQGLIFLDLQHAASGTAADLLAMVGARRVAILCRSAADATAVEAVRPDVITFLRDDSATGPADGWLADAEWEATVGRVGTFPKPAAVFVAESWFPRDEYVLLRRAWSAGVTYFLTKDLAAAQNSVARLGEPDQ